MATATEVKIQVTVDTAGAANNVKKLSAELESVARSLSGGFSNKDLDRIAESLGKAPSNAEKIAEAFSKIPPTVNQAGDSVRRLSGHTATSLDAVRLLSQEFGLRLPRAIEAMLSRMPAVTGAISGVLGGLAAVAGIEVFAHVITGAVEAYQKFFSLNSIVEKYNENLEKARQADLPNARSIETLQLRLRDQQQVAANENSNAQAQHKTGIGEVMRGAYRSPLGVVGGLIQGGTDLYLARKHGETAINAKVASDELNRKRIEATHEAALAQIELNHAQDATLTGAQKINAELKKKAEIGSEANKFQNAMDKSFGAEVSPDAGSEEEATKYKIAAGEAAAQVTLLNREMNLAIMKSNDARVQAGLQGEALYAEKLKDDIKEITQELINQGKAAEIPARVREINEKYFADASERFVKAQSDSASRSRQAQASGLTGAARIYADQYNQVAENNTKFQGGEREQANIDAKTAANQKLEELERQFTEQMNGIAESRTDATLNGYQRIDAEAKKTSDRIQEEFKKSWGGADVDQGSAQYIAARKAMQDALTAVDQSAAAERRQLANQEAEETLRYDQQAAEAERRVKKQTLLGWTTDYQAAVDEIRAQELQRTHDLEDQLAKGTTDWINYNQRLQDVHAEATAQIAAQQQQLQHQIAGELQSAFTDPLGFIKQKMEQMFFETIAAWLMQLKIFKQVFGQTMGGLQIGGGGGLGGILGGGAARPTFGGSPSAPASSSGIATSQPEVVMQGSSAGAPESTADTAYSAVAHTSFLSGTMPSTPHAASASGLRLPSAEAAGESSATSSAAASPHAATAKQGSSASSVVSTISGTNAFAQQMMQARDAAKKSGDSGLTSGADDGRLFGGQNELDQNAAAQQQQQSGASSAVSTGGKAIGVGMAGYEGYNATKAAYESDSIGGTFKGALQDAMVGASIGMMFGPAGALIGAGVGALVGLTAGVAGMITGQGPRLKARDYYRQTLFPEIEAERHADTSDYQTAISNVNQIASDGVAYMSQHFGRDAADWVNANYLKKEQQLADAQIEARAKGGEYATSLSAAQFHTGGIIRGFGSFGTSNDEGFIHARLNEAVMNPTAVAMHTPAIHAMNSGASPFDIAKMYLASVPQSSGGQSGGGHSTTQHITIQALDSKSFDHALKNGGARTVQKHLNNLSYAYAGDAASG